MSVTSVRLKPELEKSLESMAQKSHRSKSWLINQAIREYLDHEAMEQARWQDTLQAMESVSHGQVVSGEAVHDWLASWGSENELSPPESDR